MTKGIKLLAISIFSITLSSCDSRLQEPTDCENKFARPKIEFNPRSYVCYKTNEKLSIDGNLNEVSWKDAKWSKKFIDIEGAKEPLFETRVKMLWDDKYLYIGAELMDPHINAQLRERDTVIFYDNDFEVFIDPDGDTHSYYEFEINALNTVWDLFLNKPYRDPGSIAVDGWDIYRLKSAVKIYGTINNPSDTDEKWTVELAFPYKAFQRRGNSTPNDGDTWRLNFSRVHWQYEVVDGQYKKKINPDTGKPFPEYNWVWSPQGLINMHYPEMWGFLLFSTKSPNNGGENFELNENEKMKWELRKIYYYQRNYFNNYGKFLSELKELKSIGLQLDNSYNYEVSATNNLFEAQAKKDDVTWNINNEGRTWK